MQNWIKYFERWSVTSKSNTVRKNLFQCQKRLTLARWKTSGLRRLSFGCDHRTIWLAHRQPSTWSAGTHSCNPHPFVYTRCNREKRTEKLAIWFSGCTSLYFILIFCLLSFVSVDFSTQTHQYFRVKLTYALSTSSGNTEWNGTHIYLAVCHGGIGRWQWHMEKLEKQWRQLHINCFVKRNSFVVAVCFGFVVGR